jgi:peptide/nickel transport system ATP-binding protein
MLLSSIPVISDEEEAAKPEKVESIGEIPSPVNLPTGCSFHTRCPYVMDICKQVDPLMVEIGPGHIARCHLFEQSATVSSRNQSDDEQTGEDASDLRPAETEFATLGKGD